MCLIANARVQETKLRIQIFVAVGQRLHLLDVLLIRRHVPFQARRNVFFLAMLYVTKAHRALAVVDPERTFLRQVHLVVAEEVFDQNAAQPWIDFYVVVIVHGVHVATTIVDGALQLTETESIRARFEVFRIEIPTREIYYT